MEDFKPFVATDKKMYELTLLPLLTGAVLGIIFGASSLYLALKIGMTVSASIPIAVLSITLFKSFSKVFKIRQTTILENNIVQTAGSAGESIAFGVAVTMPAILILGYDMELGRIMLVAVLGALLGILMMIPLRYALIVKNHKILPFPEGTACAEVLIVGEKGGTSAKTVFTGFFVGLIYKILNIGAKLWVDAPMKAFAWYKGSYFSTDVSPELLGVGYIIGPRIASTTVAGGILSAFVLTPAIVLFGSQLTAPLFPATQLISDMSTHDIWKNYILYIGAGAVATGGIISLFQSLPTIIKSLISGLSNLKGSQNTKQQLRTEQEIPMQYVLAGIGLLVIAIWAIPTFHMNLLGAFLIVLFGFLFVTVSARITGEIGQSANPISGMTVATLLFTCLIFLLMGWIEPQDRVTALSIAGIVCVAAANAGITSQDLKTGYLVGATPKAQQIAILFGALVSATVIGYILILLNDASTVYAKRDFSDVTIEASLLTKKEKLKGPEAQADANEYYAVHITQTTGSVPVGKYLVTEQGKIAYLVDPGINGTLKTRDDGSPVQKYDAPKAMLMSLIIDGIMAQKLPWGLVFIGAFIALVMHLCGISVLPFAVGVYLPLAVSAPIFFGGAVRWLVEKTTREKTIDSDSSPGVLLSSGLIAGASIAGIGIALMSLNAGFLKAIDLSSVFHGEDLFAYCIFGALMLFLYLVGSKRIAK